MFLHSGASLHGHEYSNRPSPAAGAAGQRRNHLFRTSAFASTPVNRSPVLAADSPASAPRHSSPRHAKSASVDVASIPYASARFANADHEFGALSQPALKPEAMSEDETSVEVSDSDTSRAGSSARRSRRRTPRKSTTYLLAHPAPKLSSKQRILHIRPKLFLQLQQLSAGKRPRPAIDVYPSSAIAGSVIAPLLKRFPRIARIKRELSIQDVMIVRSEDYDSPSQDSDSDGDENHLEKRELVAILSPLRTEDKAEIVMEDGSVWFASPRSIGTGPSTSYEFTRVDEQSQTMTARWVRKQVANKSFPPSPLSSIPGTPSTPSPVASDYKFTFSFIDPNTRRHPILATLTNSSLDVLDSYTTVSPSAGKYPPTSPLLATPMSLPSEAPTERTTLPVEDWQKTFISVSAIWVALRHGWTPNCRPEDVVSHSAASSTTPTRSASFSYRSETPDRLQPLEVPKSGRRKYPPTAMREASIEPASPVPGLIPRRATSSGAAYMQKRRAMQRNQNEASDVSDTEPATPTRRALSGDWSAVNRLRESSLAAVMLGKRASVVDEDTEPVPTLIANPLPSGRRAVSEFYAQSPVFAEPVFSDVQPLQREVQSGTPVHTDHETDGESSERRGKHQRWKSIGNWFRKLQGR